MGSAKSIYSPRNGQALHWASSPEGGMGEAASPACPPEHEGPGSPSPWHQPARWGSRAANSEHLRPGQTQPPLPEQALSAPGRRTRYLWADGLRGAGTPLHGVFRNQWVEKPALNVPGCPYLLDLPSEVQAFNFDLHSTFGACVVSARVQPTAGAGLWVHTSSSSASGHTSRFKLQPPLDSIKVFFSLDRTWPGSNAWVRNKDKPWGRRSCNISKLIYNRSAFTLKR